jgi:hypothetical protein
VSSIQGLDALKARLKALRKDVIKPVHKAWADEAVKIARADVGGMTMPYSKGRHLLGSIKRKTATQRKAVVVASYHAYFVDHGVVSHSLQRRKSRPKGGFGRTIFAATARKPHPGYRARPFRVHAAEEAFRRTHPMDRVIAAWNGAA